MSVWIIDFSTSARNAYARSHMLLFGAISQFSKRLFVFSSSSFQCPTKIQRRHWMHCIFSKQNKKNSSGILSKCWEVQRVERGFLNWIEWFLKLQYRKSTLSTAQCSIVSGKNRVKICIDKMHAPTNCIANGWANVSNCDSLHALLFVYFCFLFPFVFSFFFSFALLFC